MKWKVPASSVGTKLFMYFALGILIPVSLVGLFSYFLSTSIIKDEVSKANEGAIKQASDKMDVYFKQYESVITQIVLNDDIRGMMVDPTDETSNSAALQMIDNILPGFPEISAISIVDTEKDDVVISSADEAFFKDTLSGEAWMETMLTFNGKIAFFATTPYSSLFDPKKVENKIKQQNELSKEAKAKSNEIIYTSSPVFTLASPIRDNSGANKFIVLIEINQSFLADSLSGVSPNAKRLLLLDPKQAIVYSNQPDEVATPSFAFDKSKLSYEKDKHSISYYQSDYSQWTLVSSTPVSILTERVNSIRDLTLASIVLSIIIAICLGWLVVHQIARPLNSLRNLMYKAKMGDLTIRMPIFSKDEIGQVAESFNEMMSQFTNLIRQSQSSMKNVLGTAEELMHVSTKIVSTAKHIHMATSEIALGSSLQAAEAERVSELSHNVQAQVDKIVSSSEQMAFLTNQVKQAGNKGSQFAIELIGKSNHTEVMTLELTKKVDQLKESTNGISQILHLLNNIATQTNILSLNAAIEAASAGAAGKGFNVVASEIRILAAQSKQSIELVRDIVNKLQSEMDLTLGVLVKLSPIFNEQIHAARVIDSHLADVQDTMNLFENQLNGVTESVILLDKSQEVLSNAMVQVSAVSEQSSANSEEVAALTTEQLVVNDDLIVLLQRLEGVSGSLEVDLKRFVITD